jgi:hypothetical protein
MIQNYNPDVLSCLANLSNDEVFTPPNIANQMLDLLPEEIWRDKNITFLDPACKTGIFLREIAKRLMTGLEKEIPDRQKRINHIFKKQLFALPITNITACFHGGVCIAQKMRMVNIQFVMNLTTHKAIFVLRALNIVGIKMETVLIVVQA